MDDKNGFVITNRDRVLKAWLNSTELVRDYQAYSQEMEDDRVLSKLFGEYAQSEAQRAARLSELLKGYEKTGAKR